MCPLYPSAFPSPLAGLTSQTEPGVIAWHPSVGVLVTYEL